MPEAKGLHTSHFLFSLCNSVGFSFENIFGFLANLRFHSWVAAHKIIFHLFPGSSLFSHFKHLAVPYWHGRFIYASFFLFAGLPEFSAPMACKHWFCGCTYIVARECLKHIMELSNLCKFTKKHRPRSSTSSKTVLLSAPSGTRTLDK